MTSPTDLVNIALDQIGVETTVQNISPAAPAGNRAAEVAARNYQPQVDATFRASADSTTSPSSRASTAPTQP